MGFLSKAFRKGIKKRVAQMPRRRGGFLRGMPMMKPSIGDMRFRGRMPRGGGFGFGLGEAIRRLNEQQGMRPQPISDRMPDQETLDKFRQIASRPNPFVRDMTNLQVPTDMPMTQDFPEVAPIEMMPQMRMGGMQDMEPRMMMAGGGLAKGILTGVKNILGKNQRKPIGDLVLQAKNLNRIRNAENAIIGGGLLGGAAVTDATQGFTEQASMQNMMLNSPEQLGKDLAGMRIGLDRLIDIASQKAKEIGAAPGEYVGRAQRAYEAEMEAERMQQLDAEQGLKNVSLLMAEGGEADSDDFPDLSGDGETTFKDVLIGRGVDLKAEGGEMMTQENEIDAMLSGMDSEEAGAMEDLEQMAPEMEMIDQLVTMVVQMIQQGASEEEVIMFLREQGLDDEDIGTVLQLVAEMAEAEAMPQDGIGAELAQLS